MTHPKSDHVYEKIRSDSVAEPAEEHGVPVVLRDRPDDEELMMMRFGVTAHMMDDKPAEEIREGKGVVTGADARRGRSLLIERIRTEDGTDLPAIEFFRTMGDYLIGRP